MGYSQEHGSAVGRLQREVRVALTKGPADLALRTSAYRIFTVRVLSCPVWLGGRHLAAARARPSSLLAGVWARVQGGSCGSEGPARRLM